MKFIRTFIIIDLQHDSRDRWVTPAQTALWKDFIKICLEPLSPLNLSMMHETKINDICKKIKVHDIKADRKKFFVCLAGGEGNKTYFW